MKLAMLSPIAWRTPPRHYGPWERVVSLLSEGLIKKNVDLTLFATGDSITKGKLHSIVSHGYEEDHLLDPKVWECLHISEVFEHAHEFDLIHNNFDFLPLTYSRLIKTPMITTIHGFSSKQIIPVYKKYNNTSYYVSISDTDRSPELDYIETIYHGIDIKNFTFKSQPDEDYLLFFGRIHPDKGTKEAISIAKKTKKRLIIAGILQDRQYFEKCVKPSLCEGKIEYIGSVGPKQRNKLLGNAIALLHPISFNEPFGLSIIESMACGTPVIAFYRGSMPEIIENGYNGYLVNNTTEAIDKVQEINNINRSECRKTVEEKFTVEIMVNKYLTVYERILHKNRS
jgi:glycosyltransferase involved in cell wall biosynthesis